MGAIGTAAAVLVAGAGLVAATADAAPVAAFVRVGIAPAIPGGAHAAAAPAGSQKLDLDVSLKPRNAAALSGFVQAVSQPSSLEYHHYLSKGQFAATFGPTQATITATENALRAEGLTVGAVSSDGLTIPVTTTISKAESVFATGFAGYKLSDGKTAYANSSAPQLPTSISANVVGILGLDTLSTPTPDIASSGHVVKAPAATTKVKADTAKPGDTPPQVCSSWTDGFDSLGLTDGTDYYSPASLATVYGTTSDLSAGDDGSGVSVGVYELEGIDLTGVSDFESCMGISNSVTVQKIDGGATIPVNIYTNDGVETALDVETIASMAPGVSIIDYEGPDAVNATETNELDTYQAMVTDDTVKVISSSWGLCELDNDSPFLNSENNIFEEAAAQGQTVLAAAGDQGSTACDYATDPPQSNAASLSVSDPASQPDVLGVGGTGMQGISKLSSLNAWNSDGDATGGGVSSVWSLPSGGYQQGFTGSGYHNACTAPGGSTCRQVPDVSALADPNEGYMIEVVGSDAPIGDPNGELESIEGGTSGAAPLWAAIIAMADASTACSATGAVGLVNPALYEAKAAGTAGVFTDVTVGNNVVPDSGYTGSDYQAGTGYDLTTGLGTPLAAGVTKAVCAAVQASAASYYVPMAPTRILDTRNAIGLSGKLNAGATDKLAVAGKNGIPVGVTAVVLNITVTNTGGNGFITSYPDGTAVPNASNVNFTKGETVPNLAVVPVGADGSVDFTNGGTQTGPTDLIADVSGYFTASSGAAGASTYTTLSPVRVIDTRSGFNGISGQLGAGKVDTLEIDGLDGVAADATAVVANITVTNTDGNGFIIAYPAGSTAPNTSNVNFTKGETVPNSAIIPVGTGGAISFTNGGTETGPTDLIVDISGYFTAGTGGLVYHAAYPDRVMDTRNGAGKIAKGATRTLSLDIPGTLLPQAQAVISNLTVTNPGGPGFITAYPAGSSVPNTSNVNFTTNETVPNLAIIPVGSNDSVSFTNGGTETGPTDLIVDISGYFSSK